MVAVICHVLVSENTKNKKIMLDLNKYSIHKIEVPIK